MHTLVFDRVDLAGVGFCELRRFQRRRPTLVADDRRHPVRCTTRRSSFARLALKVVNHRNQSEASTIAQAVHIDNRARSRRRFRDCRDEDPAIDGISENHRFAFRSDNSRPATNHPTKPRIGPQGPQRCAGYGYGRKSMCTPAMECLPAALKAADAHEYYRNDTHPNVP